MTQPPIRLAVAGASGLIGSQVVAAASAAGHEVVPLGRRYGVDLTDASTIGDRLTGVDAVVDVTRPSSMDRSEATGFFTTVAGNLAAAAREAGVRRCVVLSIVGIEQSQDFDWYVATLAHEQATRELAPGARVLRATQFHEFPGQVLRRALDGASDPGRAEIMDMPTQPVASVEVARLLVEMATSKAGPVGSPDVQLAGPRREDLVDLVRRLVALRGDPVRVEPGPASASMAGGSVLPGPEALVRGVTWETWARAEYASS